MANRSRLIVVGAAAVVVVAAIALATTMAGDTHKPAASAHTRDAVSFASVSPVHMPPPCVQGMVPARKEQICYQVTSSFASATDVLGVEVVKDLGQFWAIKMRVDGQVLDGIHNDGHQYVALVVDNVVVAAPIFSTALNDNILRIAPGFTRDEAITLATKIFGIDRAQVHVTEPTTIPRKNAAAVFVGTPKGCKQPCGLGDMDFVDASAVTRATARHDAKLGWVVDVQLSLNATLKLARDEHVAASVLGQTVVATRNGASFTLSMISWYEAKARALVAALTPSVA